jgi:hypothetical protein
MRRAPQSNAGGAEAGLVAGLARIEEPADLPQLRALLAPPAQSGSDRYSALPSAHRPAGHLFRRIGRLQGNVGKVVTKRDAAARGQAAGGPTRLESHSRIHLASDAGSRAAAGAQEHRSIPRTPLACARMSRTRFRSLVFRGLWHTPLTYFASFVCPRLLRSMCR